MDSSVEKANQQQQLETMNEIDPQKPEAIQSEGDLDVGAQIVQQFGTDFTDDGKILITSAFGCGPADSFKEKKKVLRKIDWHVIPLAAWACGLQFVDKVCLHLMQCHE